MTSILYAVDVSNWNPADLGPLIAQHKPQHVVVRLSTESQHRVNVARQQLTTALQAGCTVSGYVWVYFDLSPAEHTAHALSVADGFPVDLVWFDCEGDSANGQVDNWLSQAVALVESRKKRAGIYTSAPWWRVNGNSQGFSRLPLWLADWTENPTLDPPTLGWFGGWTELGGKQWSDTNGTLDRDVFDASLIVPTDPCAKLRADLAAIVAAKPYRAPSRKQIAALLSP